jgi:hypothetical protein
MANFHVARIDDDGESVTILESFSSYEDADAVCEHWSERYPYAYVDIFSDADLIETSCMMAD